MDNEPDLRWIKKHSGIDVTYARRVKHHQPRREYRPQPFTLARAWNCARYPLLMLAGGAGLLLAFGLLYVLAALIIK